MSEDKNKHLAEMRHTAAHVLAAASVQLHSESRLGVGVPIENGFYQDIDIDGTYSEEDLKKLQKEMEKIKKKDLPITQRTMSKEEARKLYTHDPFKLELIDNIKGDEVGMSDMGDGWFLNLCKGGHVESTGKIGYFKLTRLAGVYWKGDESREQLQRIYGVLFPTKKELDEHLANLEEAKKRDHRKLGRDLDLFAISPLVGSGLPLFTPKGTIIRRELEDYLQSIQEPLGYERVTIPHLARPDLYKISGHWDKFKDDIFHVRGKHESEFVLKPMNCPHHTQIYASRQRSYRDLPLRYSEVTMMYRDEQPGELQGLSRVRSISIDDAHVFCRPDQIQDEVKLVLDVIKGFYSVFDFELSYRLSLRDPSQPDKYLGTDEIWDQAQTMLEKALGKQGIKKFERAEGEAAFYGPKIDFVARDSLGRDWQLATIQLDFNMPQRFELQYISEAGEQETPVMIHRAITGSLERFMAILLEHYAGNLPLWLSPVQVLVLPITDDQIAYANDILKQLSEANIRVEIDDRAESIGKKIRDGELQKFPIMLIVGKKEEEGGTVSLRNREGDQGSTELEAVIKDLKKKLANRA